MYLLESICKNVGTVYVQLFGDILLPLFTVAVDGATVRDKPALYRLTETWKSVVLVSSPNSTGPLFPLPLLAQIDEFVHEKVRQEFRAALSELHTIELPVIKNLTTMAETLSQFASSIITPIIEDHVKNVRENRVRYFFANVGTHIFFSQDPTKRKTTRHVSH
jgi:hypothetical protein